jgi:hypothetical protein
MKANTGQRTAPSPPSSEAHLIEQLRRDTVPQYFTEDDQRVLADKVRKAVREVLKK